jgi:hypothetical protein
MLMSTALPPIARLLARRKGDVAELEVAETRT